MLLVKKIWIAAACLAIIALTIAPGAAFAFQPEGGPGSAVPTLATSGSAQLGPDVFPAGYNPLTGQPVEDRALLDLPPAMVSVTNFPVSARPQAGLSSASLVFEIYIGMGMTRYLALFYGSFPPAGKEQLAGSSSAGNAGIGPVRSGRLPYESLRRLYNGSLVMAGASSEVGARLNDSTTIYGSDKDNINSALIDVSRLRKIAEANRGKQNSSLNLTGNRFDPAAPEGGKEAQKADIFYNFYNQIEWSYDLTSGAYLRSQDHADGKGVFYPSTDRLTGEQLAFQNVVVLFANHNAIKPTIIDIDLLYTRMPALLFRDGKAYRIYADTMNGEYEKASGLLRPVRFVDSQGKPFPLKPGQTWVEIVTSTTAAQESAPGNWNIRFYAP